MDAETKSEAGAQPASGGSVEPANRSASTRSPSKDRPPASRAERYELWDPLAEVTYRSDKLEGMISTAVQLGRTRFTAIAADGSRTVVYQAGDTWKRGDSWPARSERPIDPSPHADEPRSPRARVTDSEAQPAMDVSKVDRTPSAEGTGMEAERAAQIARLESSLLERYVVKRVPSLAGDLPVGITEYRYRGDSSRVAFTASTFRLATESNNPSVARSMVDLAQARQWKGLRVTGSDDFRRQVWLEASIRGVRTQGYEPSPEDVRRLRREQELRQANRIEPAQTSAPGTTGADKPSARGTGGRKAVIAAIEAVLVAKGLSEAKRTAVLAAAAEKLAQRSARGQTTRVRLYDPSAEPSRDLSRSAPEPVRSHERATPVPSR